MGVGKNDVSLSYVIITDDVYFTLSSSSEHTCVRESQCLRLKTAVCCALCRSIIVTKNRVTLISNAGIQHKCVRQNYKFIGSSGCLWQIGLPQQICQKCKRRIETLERATKDLVAFRDQATTNCNQLAMSRGSLKRTKVTSREVFVSPSTA